jgi:hypothetical protein
MSSLRKMAEARKAAIRKKAEAEAAEIDRELAELERISAKYGLSVTEPPQPAKAEPVDKPANALASLITTVGETLTVMSNASLTAKARAAAEAYIRSKNQPVTLGELHDMLERNGVKFVGESPRNTLSAILGQTPSLYSISRDKGWWLKDVPVPEPSLFVRRM